MWFCVIRGPLLVIVAELLCSLKYLWILGFPVLDPCQRRWDWVCWRAKEIIGIDQDHLLFFRTNWYIPMKSEWSVRQIPYYTQSRSFIWGFCKSYLDKISARCLCNWEIIFLISSPVSLLLCSSSLFSGAKASCRLLVSGIAGSISFW